METPRGSGKAIAIQGAPGSETITVRFDNLAEVDFRAAEVWLPGQFTDLQSIETFLEADPSAAVARIEEFLADPNRLSAPEAPAGGRTLGAKTHWCDCSCGKASGCMRLSTAPGIHQPQTGSCRCERKGCPCA